MLYEYIIDNSLNNTPLGKENHLFFKVPLPSDKVLNRNCEGPDISPYLQAYKLAAHILCTYTNRRHKTSEAEKKTNYFS